jgi:protein-disulfide isomerase
MSIRSILRLTSLSALLSLGSLVPAHAVDDKDLDQHIHDYIIAHPEVIVEALQKVQDQEQAAQAKSVSQLIQQNQSKLLHDAASPVMGNPNGDVTLVEFFDYRCPYCKADAPQIAELIDKDPKVRVVMKEYPILGPASVFATKVALVAAKYGKYAAFHDAMFAFKGQLDDKKTLQIAHSVGLDPVKTKKEAEDPAIAAQIQDNLDLAKAVGVNGTPNFIIGDTLLPSALTLKDLQQLVASERSKG